MKQKILLSIVMLLTLSWVNAQTLVSTDPQPKNAVLEEFTGIHCGYCPDGHAIAAALLENNPGRVVVIAIHQGSFAQPSGGEPDYRTPWGDALANQSGLTGYPNGTVNRHIFMAGHTAMSRGDWTPSAHEIMQEISPVNVGIMSQYDDVTRELTVNVELYYTSDAAEATNFINVALIQSHIFGPQTGGGAGNNYEHMHMLRDLITGQWGEEVSPTTAGTLIEKTYTYTVPEDFIDVPVIVEDCDIAVFVTETHQEILSGDVVTAIDGTNLFIGYVTVTDDFSIKAGTEGEITTFNLETESNIEGTEDFVFTLESENAPADWDAVFIIDGTTYSGTATISLEAATAEDITVEITPGSASQLAQYTMTKESVSNPNAPVKSCSFSLIAGITDMVVTGTSGPEAIEYEYIYTEGLEESGCTSYTAVPANIFVEGINADVFGDVNNVYYNVSWTFPALTLDQIAAAETFMDNGGNFLIGGQDIGWDFMSGATGSHGSPEATEFYEDYLYSDYINDGNTSNNQLRANLEDDVYSEIPQSSVVDVFGGYMYPEVISARDEAVEVFYYDVAQTKAAVVKTDNGIFKMIYFGIGLEMIGDEDVKNQIIAVTRDWFDGVSTSVEFNEAMKKLNIGQNFPNPAENLTTVSIEQLESDAVFNLMDINGKTVKKINIQSGSKKVELDLSGLNSGTYFYHLIIHDKNSETKKLIVK
ncbi:MAG: Omp28-related outer membrane protein [Bacteroidales bacterium]|nr:Omp28-related outer membrane protein [Bacteroidales bacterium]